jgi:pimeloyl-ACP methyl ester carboxylesterase
MHVVRVGQGPRVLLIHGSAADHTSWAIQLASPLRERFTLVAYDRRADATTVEEHAADAAEVLARERALVVTSSFGAVVALELIRTRPELCVGAVMIEPPMGAADDIPAAPAPFLAEFDRLVAREGGPAAGEFFLRTVLGDAAFDRIPRAYQDRSKQKWAEIRADSAALLAYRPRYAELGAIDVPVLLVGGERSASYFRPTLEALARALPRARIEIVAGAGHMLHAEAPRRFAELVTTFADELEIE